MYINEKQIKGWLLNFGKSFGINKIYQYPFEDLNLEKTKDYFTFEIISTDIFYQEKTKEIIIKDDKNKENFISEMWKTTISVSCYSENGLHIMQCLHMSKDIIIIKGIQNLGCNKIISCKGNNNNKLNGFNAEFTFVGELIFN